VVRDARRILWFGFAGFGIAVVLGLLDNFIDLTPGTTLSSLFGLADIILCPGSLLFVLAIDIEPGSSGFLLMWLVIAVINFALYTAIGVAYVGLLTKRQG